MAFKSLLYVPANRPRMQEKARVLSCDAVIFDLEDSVAIEEKTEARENLKDHLAQPFPKPFLIRVNAVDTEFFQVIFRCWNIAPPKRSSCPKQTGIPWSLQDQDLMNWELISARSAFCR